MLAHIGALESARARQNRDTASLTNREESVVGAPTSEDLGVRELNKFLTKAGVKRGDVRFEEGSGLSRNNLVTPNATIALLTFMSKHAEAKSYYEALPIAGRDAPAQSPEGAPRRRQCPRQDRHVALGQFHVGLPHHGSRREAGVCLMLNRYAAPSPEFSARAELDKIIVQLADFTGAANPTACGFPRLLIGVGGCDGVGLAGHPSTLNARCVIRIRKGKDVCRDCRIAAPCAEFCP